jgi:RNA polymerase sigma factor (sigma-70 family)
MTVSPPAPPPSSKDAGPMVASLLGIARYHARRKGLTREDAEDCAAEFVARTLERTSADDSAPPPLPCGPPRALLHWRARNCAEDFRRRAAVRQRRELPWPDAPDAHPRAEPVATAAAPDEAAGPEAELLRAEFWWQVRLVLARLEPEPRRLFLGHHLWGESLDALAAETGRTVPAVKQALARARRRLRVALERRGYAEADLRAFLR